MQQRCSFEAIADLFTQLLDTPEPARSRQLQDATLHALIATSMSKRATTLMLLQRYDEAQREIDAALAMFAAANAAQSMEGLLAQETQARILHQRGDTPQALARIDAVLALWRERFPARKERLQSLLETRVLIEQTLGDHVAARATAREPLSLGVNEGWLRAETAQLLHASARAP